MEAYCVNFLFKRNRIKYIPNDLIKFKGKLYEIIVAEKGTEAIVEEILYEIGPKLWEKKHSLLEQHLNKLLNKAKSIYKSLNHSEKADVKEKIKLYQTKIKALEEKLQCLSNAK